MKAWRAERKDSLGEYSGNYYAQNKAAQLEAQKCFRDANPEIIKARRRAHYAKNKLVILAKNRDYQLNNPEMIKSIRASWHKSKLLSCPVFALKLRYRARVRMAIRKGGFHKSSSTAALLGCTWECMKDHIESKFCDGMSWENMRLWHIDHITPLASAKDSEEVAKLCHYTNLQPLWAEDNLSKGCRMPEQ